ncbi:MAG TPA: efflux transporter outer membrane subunit [Thermoanaerobaculia bacterium]
MRKAIVVLGLMLLGACRQLAPPHVLPELPAPPAYPSDFAGDTTGVPAADLHWREFFVDQRLEALIAAALEHNRELAVAIAQIEQARGFYRIDDSARLPTVRAGADVTVGRAGGDSFDRYSIGVGVPAFELDFWGRVRNLSEAARAEYLASIEAQRAFRLVLIREVASVYLFSLEAAERIQLAESTVQSREEGLEIARVRLDAGITSALEFRQAETLLTQAQAELAGLRLTKARNDNALAVLVGGPVPSPLPEAVPLAQQISAQALAAGLPSELLVVRPDITAAEERLRAARADIGAARAAFFPSIALTGNLGFASSELSALFGSDGLTWSLGPSISLPIFNRGRLRGNLTVTEANETIAVARYERAIQIAFREVADALAGRRYLAEQVAAQERGTRAQREIAELARIRYREGVVRYLEVLDAERNLFAAEQGLLQLRRAQAQNLVALYVALGGGLAE